MPIQYFTKCYGFQFQTKLNEHVVCIVLVRTVRPWKLR